MEGEAGRGQDFCVVVPDVCTVWQQKVMARLVGVLGGRVVRERQYKAGAVSGDCHVIELPTLTPEEGITPAEGEEVKGPAEIELEIVHATGGTAIWVTVPADVTVGQLKRTIADRCGDDVDEVVPRMRLMRKWSTSTFLPFRDQEQLGSRRRLLAMGVNFAGVPPRLPRAGGLDASAAGETPPKSRLHQLNDPDDSEDALLDLTNVSKAEAGGLLLSSLDLLEDPTFMGDLAELDGKTGGTLAMWEPPWEEEGYEELDVQDLSSIETETVKGWVENFVLIVNLLANKAEAQKRGAPN